MRHASIYSGAAMLSRLVGFIMLPFYAHILRDEGYAVIGMVDVGVALLASLLGYGFTGAIILHYHEEKNPGRKRRVVSTGVIITTATSFALALPAMICGRPVSALILNDPDLSRLLVMALVGFVFEMAGQAASSWLLIRSRSVLFASVNLFRLVIGLALNIVLIVVLRWDLDGYFVSSLITSVLSNTILVLLTSRDCGWKFDSGVAVSMRRFMLPLVPGNLVSFVSRQVERVLVKFQVGLGAVGILEMGYKFPILIAQLISVPFMQSWGTRRFEIADQPDAPRRIGRMFTFYLFLVCYMGLVMAVTIRPVLAILTPPEFHLSYRIAQLEILTMVLSGCESHLNFGLFYAKHTGVITKIRSATAIVKIGLAYVFVNAWSIYGAAFSAAIMAAVTAVVVHRLAQARYRVIFEWSKVFVIGAAAASCFALTRAWDVARLPGYSVIADNLIPWLDRALTDTFLGTWHDSVLLRLLREDSKQLAEIIMNGTLALTFGLLLPWVRDRSLATSGGLLAKLDVGLFKRARRPA